MKRARDHEPITAGQLLAHARARLARLSSAQAIRLPQTLALRANWRQLVALSPRTSSGSAAFARSGTAALAGEGTAARIARASLAWSCTYAS